MYFLSLMQDFNVLFFILHMLVAALFEITKEKEVTNEIVKNHFKIAVYCDFLSITPSLSPV